MKIRKRILNWKYIVLIFCALTALHIVHNSDARAEFGDVVINNYSDNANMPPVVFPHWFHRIRFRCKVCHGDLEFKFEAGGNDITMLKIFDGEYCGACHNGEIAWSVENCALCHTGKAGTKTQVHNSTLKLIMPKAKAKPASKLKKKK